MVGPAGHTNPDVRSEYTWGRERGVGSMRAFAKHVGLASALCFGLIASLPHITLLYLNAAHAQLLGNDYWALTKQLLTEGPIEAFTRPKFMREASGVLTKDGKSGMVWTTNVLSTYVLVSHEYQCRSSD